ncbi:unnamed protein product [Bursaphelenchus xylophilus]|uniref:(pine wood nematode) hypothetical protein n=1 Tax=Bursaphelenchus xylophilus TaxID=6326 RepID=A0A1I7RNS9_BURXY|nr:unnamed protein product [Bursaphelenchus xylophilus]CAG9124264.1 unnamed protein product [Bursaphelenchus xylophilus]
MPLKFNFELKWGEAARAAKAPPKKDDAAKAPPRKEEVAKAAKTPSPPKPPTYPTDDEGSCSTCSTSSSSSSESERTKSLQQAQGPIVQNFVYLNGKEDTTQKSQQSKVQTSGNKDEKDVARKNKEEKDVARKNKDEKDVARKNKEEKDVSPTSYTKYVTVKSLADFAGNTLKMDNDYDEEKARQEEEAERNEREKTQYLDFNPAPIDKTNKVIFVRTGERMDGVFPSWSKTTNCYGQYRRYNANQPATLPIRRHGIHGFKKDSPLTCYGQKLSHLVASSLKRARYRPVAVYSAPALRCIETASYIVNVLKAPKIRIEHGLDQNIADILKERPVYMTNQELLEGGYPIDDEYQSIMKPFTEEVTLDESQVNVRIRNTMGRIMGNHEKGIILIVTHAVIIIQGAKYLINSTKEDNIDETAAAKLLPLCSVLVMTTLDGVFNMDEKYQVLPFTNCQISTAPKIAQLKKLL